MAEPRRKRRAVTLADDHELVAAAGGEQLGVGSGVDRVVRISHQRFHCDATESVTRLALARLAARPAA